MADIIDLGKRKKEQKYYYEFILNCSGIVKAPTKKSAKAEIKEKIQAVAGKYKNMTLTFLKVEDIEDGGDAA